MTPATWVACLKVLKAAFGASCSLDRDQAAADVWFSLLADLPDEVAKAAVAQICRDTKAFPSVAAIRQAAQAIVVPSPSALPTADAAWAEACRWVSALPTWVGGQVIQPEPPHPLVAHVVQLLGRDGIRSRTVENEATIRAQFRRAYEPLAQQEAARLAAGAPSLLALEAPPVLLALPAGGHDTEAAQQADAEGRRAFAQAAEERRRQVNAVVYAEVEGLRTPEGRVNLEVLRQALGVSADTPKSAPVVDEERRAAAQERLAKRRGEAC